MEENEPYTTLDRFAWPVVLLVAGIGLTCFATLVVALILVVL